MTESDVYIKLREHLDSLPVGYPATKSGVELRILRRLFTEEEAEMACHLTPFAATAEQIAQKSGHTPADAEKLLEQMGRKGLIFTSRKGGVSTYRASWFTVGILEQQVTRLTKEFLEDVEQYIEEGFRDEIISASTPQLRVIPVQASFDSTMQIAPYDSVRELVKQQSKLAVAECICRKGAQLKGEGCGKPLETCLVFGAGAYYYLENGFAREISQEEALEILDKAEEAGLVLQPGNAQKTFNICCCCGDCCEILKNLRKFPKPSEMVATNYYAQVDPELCSSCETCLDRCQMDAITVPDTAVIDLDRCIGCGLCVTTCPSDAITLKQKEPSKMIVPPATGTDLYIKIGTERQQRQKPA
ncbi:MAG: ATP-binding protein [Promethearchaeota archaeon]